MLDAANAAAEACAKALAVFNLVAVYVALALLQMSDADFLNGTGQALPLIGSTVPTGIFVTVVPLFLLVLHAVVLAKWANLRARANQVFGAYGCRTDASYQQLLNLLHPFSLMTFFARGTTTWYARLASSTLVLLTLIVVPLFILVAVQVRSLAFHDFDITMLHRAAVLSDLLVLWLYAPLRRLDRRGRGIVPVSFLLSVALVAYVSLDAVVPALGLRELPSRGGNLTDLLRPRRLDLNGVTLQVKAPQGEAGEAGVAYFSLEQRDLRFADLTQATVINAGLYKADFTGARLDRTRFTGATTEVLFDTAAPPASGQKTQSRSDSATVNFSYATVLLADFSGQNLSGADFTGASVIGGRFDGTELVAANFTGAMLDSSHFRLANLRKANLYIASLVNAGLRLTTLSGANLVGADLRAVTLFRNPLMLARFALADITYARVRSISETELDELRAAILRGANDRKRAEEILRNVSTRMAIPFSPAYAGTLYRMRADAAYLLRHDYLPSIVDERTQLDRQHYAQLIQAVMLKESERLPGLRESFGKRAAMNALGMAAALARVKLGIIAGPHNADPALAQTLVAGPVEYAEIGLSESRKQSDQRYAAWVEHVDGKAAAPSIGKRSWVDALVAGASGFAEGPVRPALIDMLKVASQHGDELAFFVLPYLLPMRAPDLATVQWLEAEAIKRRADADLALAIVFLSGSRSPLLAEMIVTSDTSPWTLWTIGTLLENQKLLQRAADEGSLPAALEQAWRAHVPNAALSGDAMLWKSLASTALRGDPRSQFLVGLELAGAGDYAGAKRWLQESAYTGNLAYTNAYARFLLLSPDPALRNPRAAFELASYNWSRVSAVASERVDLLEFADTLAAAYAALGQFDQAVAMQKMAVPNVSDSGPRRKVALQRLATYGAKRLWLVDSLKAPACMKHTDEVCPLGEHW